MVHGSKDVKLTHGGGIVRRADGDEPLFLLVRSRKDPELWVFPKGHIERGETPDQTAVREIQEEAGVLASIVEPLGISDFDRNGKRVTVQIYLMDYVREVPAMEDRELVWCPVAEACELLAFQDMRDLIVEASERTGA